MTHTPTKWVAADWPLILGSDSRGTVVCEMVGARSNPQAAADRACIVACVNFFHGRDIATDRIPEGGFWEMVALLQENVDRRERRIKEHYPKESYYQRCKALLAKLGIEP